MMKTLYDFPKPLVGLVQGAAVGGGVGIVACCDVVVASDASSFRLSEVKLGIVPAVISPYVVRAIGVRAAQRYFLTAEPFSATEAKTLGLVHEIVPDEQAPPLGAVGKTLAEMLERGLAPEGGPDIEAGKRALENILESMKTLMARYKPTP